MISLISDQDYILSIIRLEYNSGQQVTNEFICSIDKLEAFLHKYVDANQHKLIYRINAWAHSPSPNRWVFHLTKQRSSDIIFNEILEVTPDSCRVEYEYNRKLESEAIVELIKRDEIKKSRLYAIIESYSNKGNKQ